MAEIDINIKEVQKKDGIYKSKLKLLFSGKNVNYSLVNTFRRLSLDCIPTYAFITPSITIEKNTSITNSDNMKLRLSQITIPNIDTNIVYLDDIYWKVDYADPNRPKHPDDKIQIEFYVTTENKTNEIMNVTTNDARVFIDGNQVDKFDPNDPCLIVQLKPKQEFKCRCVGVLGVGKRNNIWAGAANCYYDEKNQNEYLFTIKSQGQTGEYEILYKSCLILKQKLENLESKLKKEYDTPEVRNLKAVIIKIESEDFTLGNMLVDVLQDSDQVTHASLSKKHHLIEVIQIKIITVESNPIAPMFDAINRVKDVMTFCEKIFRKGIDK